MQFNSHTDSKGSPCNCSKCSSHLLYKRSPASETAKIVYHYPQQHKRYNAYIEGPVTSYDCSGFVSQVFINIGKPLRDYGAGTDYPDVSTISNLAVFKKIHFNQALPGDLTIWDGHFHHVGIFEGEQPPHQKDRSQGPTFISALLNIKEKEGYRTSIQSILIDALGQGTPRILRFRDCDEDS
jgi:hypothetical protein